MPGPAASPAARAGGPDGVIFDLDGTLWDSTGTVAAAWNRALARLGSGRRVTRDQIAGVMGRSHRELYRALFPGLAESRQEALALACYAEEELAVHRQGGRLYPGVAAGLRRLARHYPLCIVSNCQRGYIEAFLAWSGLGPLLADHECHGNTGLAKADNLRLVAGRNALRDPLYVGDTEGDHAAAAAAGMAFVHAAYGFGRAPPGVAAVDSFAALVRALLPP